MLHAPPELAVVGAVALGWPVSRATRLRRQPVSCFATVDRLNGEPFA